MISYGPKKKPRMRAPVASIAPPKPPPKGVLRSPGQPPAPPQPRLGEQPVAPVAPPVQGGPVKPPETPGAAGIRANAEQALLGAGVDNRDAIFRAAMHLGDPNVLAQLQQNPDFAGYQFAQDPNSMFAQLARNEETGLRSIDDSAGDNNTFFSGMRLRDRGNLSTDISNQRLRASTDYLDQLADFAKALAKARGEYDLGLSQADQADVDAAAAAEVQNRMPLATSKPKPKPKPKPQLMGNFGGGRVGPAAKKAARKKK